MELLAGDTNNRDKNRLQTIEYTEKELMAGDTIYSDANCWQAIRYRGGNLWQRFELMNGDTIYVKGTDFR